MEITKCTCETPSTYSPNWDVLMEGVDETEGRFGDVSVRRCPQCSKLWLCYHVEYEAFSKSGRWFRCLIAGNELKHIKPENAVDVIGRSEWYFRGGSYFNGEATFASGKPHVGI